MKRSVRALLIVLALSLLSIPALAATRLTQYSLVANGAHVGLSLDTGYLFRSGSAIMVPVEAVCKEMGLGYVVSPNKDGMTIRSKDDKNVEIKLGSKYMKVDDFKRPLRVKTIRQDGKKLTCDVRLLTMLGLDFKHYKASAATKALGYKGGVLAVAVDGGDLALPDVKPVEPVIELPEAAREAGRTATQVVCVKYTGGSSAKMTFYQKEKASGKWREEFSSNAYVGKQGIGKQVEGDGKTPTGTFNLTKPFGILEDPGAKMGGYVKVTKYHYWSGQSGTKYYNRLIDTRIIDGYKPTGADERLIDYKGVYNYALFIDYNASGEAGKGSAIFLHCMGSSKSTGGCVAVPQAVMKTLLRTLKSGAKVVIYA